MKRKLMSMLLLMSVIFTSLGGVVYAHDEAIEWADNPNSWRYSLSYQGRGWSVSWDRCDWNDYVFRINKNFSAEPSKYRLHSSNSSVRSAFNGKTVQGYNLETSRDAYLCTGTRDTSTAGGASNIQSNLFVWVQ